MTLVMLACVPLLAGIGIAFTIMFTKTQARGEQAYGAAAGLVQEALSSVRTVYAFCAQGRMQARYTQVRPRPVVPALLHACGHHQHGVLLPHCIACLFAQLL